jgi:ubiquinol-cytochrome c reductase cytochrome b subunit
MFRKNELVKLFLRSFNYLPVPVNISFWWNWRSMTRVCLIVQVLSGLFLTIHYVSDSVLAFDSVVHIDRDVNIRWVFRSVHSNGASLFLLCIFMHVGRGLYYKSYLNFHTWGVGVLLLLISMLTAFFRYVLPWGQISFWRATVITNFLSVIPGYRRDIVNWIWRRYSVRGPTLTRFYTFHFLFPFVIVVLSLLHLIFLHRTGSSNPIQVSSVSLKIHFWPYSRVKDVLRFFVVFLFFFCVVFFYPTVFMDPENFIKANPMVTPVHIKPEWYFLFAYAILRCIPNKTIRVVALGVSILFLYVVPLLNFFLNWGYYKRVSFTYQLVFWTFSVNFMLLTWLGRSPVEEPYIFLAQVCSFIYFLSLVLIRILV